MQVMVPEWKGIRFTIRHGTSWICLHSEPCALGSIERPPAVTKRTCSTSEPSPSSAVRRPAHRAIRLPMMPPANQVSSPRGRAGDTCADTILRVTIACTLQDGERQGRFEEWSEFFATSVRAVVRVADGLIRAELDLAAPDVVSRAVDLARREKACCPFFELSLVIGVDDCWLEIAAPLEAVGILDGFAAFAPTPGDARS
jgi:hypothetical protein